MQHTRFRNRLLLKLLGIHVGGMSVTGTKSGGRERTLPEAGCGTFAPLRNDPRRVRPDPYPAGRIPIIKSKTQHI
jgi:hypothetical protein